MKEIFIAYLWENRLFDRTIQTTDGKTIEVVYPGTRNADAGPDFLNARIRIDDTLWAGNVELHVNASDWYNHRHERNVAYDTVVLHVVYNADKQVYTSTGVAIPTLEIKDRFDTALLLRYRRFQDSRNWMACQNVVADVQRFTWLSWLDRMIVERLEFKVEEVLQLFEQTGNDWEETMYQRLMRNFGLNVNDAPFAHLARKLTFQLLLKHSGNLFQLEAILFGVAGMLSREFADDYPLRLKKEYFFLKQKYNLAELHDSEWRFMRMRPSNFPTIRLSQLAALIHQNQRMFSRFLHAGSAGDIKPKFEVTASSYWDDHDMVDKKVKGTTKRFGRETIDLMLINSVAQVLFAYGIHNNQNEPKDKALMLLENIEAENNAIIRKFNELGIGAANALQSQAMLHLRKQYCTSKRCLECRIGQLLIRTEEGYRV